MLTHSLHIIDSRTGFLDFSFEFSNVHVKKLWWQFFWFKNLLFFYIVRFPRRDDYKQKLQCQSLGHVDVYLPRVVFSHGQLYIAILRATTKEDLKILICEEDFSKGYVAKNIVYNEVFQKIFHN